MAQTGLKYTEVEPLLRKQMRFESLLKKTPKRSLLNLGPEGFEPTTKGL